MSGDKTRRNDCKYDYYIHVAWEDEFYQVIGVSSQLNTDIPGQSGFGSFFLASVPLLTVHLCLLLCFLCLSLIPCTIYLLP